jgi:hypothetical protein
LDYAHEKLTGKSIKKWFPDGIGTKATDESYSISMGAQYVTPDSKIYFEIVKMCRFSSGNWFFCTKFVQLAVAGKWHNTPSKQSVINWT